jgi:hypothetical protein
MKSCWGRKENKGKSWEEGKRCTRMGLRTIPEQESMGGSLVLRGTKKINFFGT